jgi:hypothetical protein
MVVVVVVVVVVVAVAADEDSPAFSRGDASDVATATAAVSGGSCSDVCWLDLRRFMFNFCTESKLSRDNDASSF